MGIKSLVRESKVVGPYIRARRLKEWRENGCPLPPPDSFKQFAVFYHAVANNLNILVETGTYLGDMVWAQKDLFRRIYSIELSKELYERAKLRFKNTSNVRLIQGDSSEKLPLVLKELEGPVLFWLDGHYSGGITARGEKICPIFDELKHIFAHGDGHTVLIDDARLFVGEDDYPTLEELSSFVTANGQYNVRVEGDILVLNKTTNQTVS